MSHPLPGHFDGPSDPSGIHHQGTLLSPLNVGETYLAAMQPVITTVMDNDNLPHGDDQHDGFHTSMGIDGGDGDDHGKAEALEYRPLQGEFCPPSPHSRVCFICRCPPKRPTDSYRISQPEVVQYCFALPVMPGQSNRLCARHYHLLRLHNSDPTKIFPFEFNRSTNDRKRIACTVVTDPVQLKAVGTAIITKETGFDAIEPTTTASGLVIYPAAIHDDVRTPAFTIDEEVPQTKDKRSRPKKDGKKKGKRNRPIRPLTGAAAASSGLPMSGHAEDDSQLVQLTQNGRGMMQHGSGVHHNYQNAMGYNAAGNPQQQNGYYPGMAHGGPQVNGGYGGAMQQMGTQLGNLNTLGGAGAGGYLLQQHGQGMPHTGDAFAQPNGVHGGDLQHGHGYHPSTSQITISHPGPQGLPSRMPTIPSVYPPPPSYLSQPVTTMQRVNYTPSSSTPPSTHGHTAHTAANGNGGGYSLPSSMDQSLLKPPGAANGIGGPSVSNTPVNTSSYTTVVGASGGHPLKLSPPSSTHPSSMSGSSTTPGLHMFSPYQMDSTGVFRQNSGRPPSMTIDANGKSNPLVQQLTTVFRPPDGVSLPTGDQQLSSSVLNSTLLNSTLLSSAAIQSAMTSPKVIDPLKPPSLSAAPTALVPSLINTAISGADYQFRPMLGTNGTLQESLHSPQVLLLDSNPTVQQAYASLMVQTNYGKLQQALQIHQDILNTQQRLAGHHGGSATSLSTPFISQVNRGNGFKSFSSLTDALTRHQNQQSEGQAGMTQQSTSLPSLPAPELSSKQTESLASVPSTAPSTTLSASSPSEIKTEPESGALVKTEPQGQGSPQQPSTAPTNQVVNDVLASLRERYQTPFVVHPDTNRRHLMSFLSQYIYFAQQSQSTEGTPSIAAMDDSDATDISPIYGFALVNPPLSTSLVSTSASSPATAAPIKEQETITKEDPSSNDMGDAPATPVADAEAVSTSSLSLTDSDQHGQGEQDVKVDVPYLATKVGPDHRSLRILLTMCLTHNIHSGLMVASTPEEVAIVSKKFAKFLLSSDKDSECLLPYIFVIGDGLVISYDESTSLLIQQLIPELLPTEDDHTTVLTNVDMPSPSPSPSLHDDESSDATNTKSLPETPVSPVTDEMKPDTSTQVNLESLLGVDLSRITTCVIVKLCNIGQAWPESIDKFLKKAFVSQIPPQEQPSESTDGDDHVLSSHQPLVSKVLNDTSNLPNDLNVLSFGTHQANRRICRPLFLWIKHFVTALSQDTLSSASSPSPSSPTPSPLTVYSFLKTILLPSLHHLYKMTNSVNLAVEDESFYIPYPDELVAYHQQMIRFLDKHLHGEDQDIHDIPAFLLDLSNINDHTLVHYLVWRLSQSFGHICDHVFALHLVEVTHDVSSVSPPSPTMSSSLSPSFDLAANDSSMDRKNASDMSGLRALPSYYYYRIVLSFLRTLVANIVSTMAPIPNSTVTFVGAPLNITTHQDPSALTHEQSILLSLLQQRLSTLDHQSFQQLAASQDEYTLLLLNEQEHGAMNHVKSYIDSNTLLIRQLIDLLTSSLPQSHQLVPFQLESETLESFEEKVAQLESLYPHLSTLSKDQLGQLYAMVSQSASIGAQPPGQVYRASSPSQGMISQAELQAGASSSAASMPAAVGKSTSYVTGNGAHNNMLLAQQQNQHHLQQQQYQQQQQFGQLSMPYASNNQYSMTTGNATAMVPSNLSARPSLQMSSTGASMSTSIHPHLQQQQQQQPSVAYPGGVSSIKAGMAMPQPNVIQNGTMLNTSYSMGGMMTQQQQHQQPMHPILQSQVTTRPNIQQLLTNTAGQQHQPQQATSGMVTTPGVSMLQANGASSLSGTLQTMTSNSNQTLSMLNPMLKTDINNLKDVQKQGFLQQIVPTSNGSTSGLSANQGVSTPVSLNTSKPSVSTTPIGTTTQSSSYLRSTTSGQASAGPRPFGVSPHPHPTMSGPSVSGQAPGQFIASPAPNNLAPNGGNANMMSFPSNVTTNGMLSSNQPSMQFPRPPTLSHPPQSSLSTAALAQGNNGKLYTSYANNYSQQQQQQQQQYQQQPMYKYNAMASPQPMLQSMPQQQQQYHQQQQQQMVPVNQGRMQGPYMQNQMPQYQQQQTYQTPGNAMYQPIPQQQQQQQQFMQQPQQQQPYAPQMQYQHQQQPQHNVTNPVYK